MFSLRKAGIEVYKLAWNPSSGIAKLFTMRFSHSCGTGWAANGVSRFQVSIEYANNLVGRRPASRTGIRSASPISSVAGITR